MNEPIKVYNGLVTVDRGSTYHLGFYEVAFPDGELRFEVMARICPEHGCPCDHIALDFQAQGRLSSCWYTAEREFRDSNHLPLEPELEGVFRIVEGTDTFRERYSHLVFLRRRMVLEEQGRYPAPYEMRLPPEMLGPDTDLRKHRLGRVRLGAKGGKALDYALEFCGDESCYCTTLFAVIDDHGEPRSFAIDREGRWTDPSASAAGARLLGRLEHRLAKDPLFQRQLGYFRQERQFHNYHRFVTHYLETHRVGL